MDAAMPLEPRPAERESGRIVVVSANATTRLALQSALAEAGFTVAASSSLDEALSAPSADADALVIELGTLDQPPLVAMAAHPCVLLGDWAEPPALGPFASAYLHADATIEEIIAALTAVRAGLVVADPSLLPETHGRGEQPDEVEHLTPRELEVLRLMADGLPNKGIARALGISDHTAKFHVGAILGKLEAQSRAEAVMQAARRGLIPL